MKVAVSPYLEGDVGPICNLHQNDIRTDGNTTPCDTVKISERLTVEYSFEEKLHLTFGCWWRGQKVAVSDVVMQSEKAVSCMGLGPGFSDFPLSCGEEISFLKTLHVF